MIRSRSTPFILGKIFNNEKYAENLLNGNLFINPLAVFGAGRLWNPDDGEKESTMKFFNKYRDDLNEGLAKNVNTKRVKTIDQLITFYSDIGGIPREANSIGEIDSRFLTENINCFSALFYDGDEGSLQHLNEKMFQFADRTNGKAIVIFDVKQFLKSIVTTLSETVGSPFWLGYGLVDYDYNVNDNAELDEFTKEVDYSYQQEFRFAINLQGEEIALHQSSKKVIFNPRSGTLEIDIGSIRDIAFTLSVEDYINFNFPREYVWVKHHKPDVICPFYPPFKTEISYMCPIMRTNNAVLIGEHAMFPTKRNINTFTINEKRMLKTKLYAPALDEFFLSILNTYYSRNLDICKSKMDHSMLEQMLTGFTYYMLSLGIEQCAGISVQNTSGELQVLYEDISIHDIGLINNKEYNLLSNNVAKLQPTDFAVLVTLSNQSSFDEYEYNGKKYVRVVVSKDGVLPSGERVLAGHTIWVEVSKVRFFLPEFE